MCCSIDPFEFESKWERNGTVELVPVPNGKSERIGMVAAEEISDEEMDEEDERTEERTGLNGAKEFVFCLNRSWFIFCVSSLSFCVSWWILLSHSRTAIKLGSFKLGRFIEIDGEEEKRGEMRSVESEIEEEEDEDDDDDEEERLKVNDDDEEDGEREEWNGGLHWFWIDEFKVNGNSGGNPDPTTDVDPDLGPDRNPGPGSGGIVLKECVVKCWFVKHFDSAKRGLKLFVWLVAGVAFLGEGWIVWGGGGGVDRSENGSGQFRPSIECSVLCVSVGGDEDDDEDEDRWWWHEVGDINETDKDEETNVRSIKQVTEEKGQGERNEGDDGMESENPFDWEKEINAFRLGRLGGSWELIWDDLVGELREFRFWENVHWLSIAASPVRQSALGILHWFREKTRRAVNSDTLNSRTSHFSDASRFVLPARVSEPQTYATIRNDGIPTWQPLERESVVSPSFSFSSFSSSQVHPIHSSQSKVIWIQPIGLSRCWSIH